MESFTVIKDLMKDHVNNTPGIALLERESSQVMVNKLEDLNWSVLLKQLETDSKALQIYLSKGSSIKSASYWQTLEWRRDQYKYYQLTAEQFVDQHVHLEPAVMKPGEIVNKFQAYKKGIIGRLTQNVGADLAIIMS